MSSMTISQLAASSIIQRQPSPCSRLECSRRAQLAKRSASGSTPVTVPHAPAAVRAHAHYVTTREGGSGAVRELADLILAAQGRAAENRLAQLPPVELAREVR